MLSLHRIGRSIGTAVTGLTNVIPHQCLYAQERLLKRLRSLGEKLAGRSILDSTRYSTQSQWLFLSRLLRCLLRAPSLFRWTPFRASLFIMNSCYLVRHLGQQRVFTNIVCFNYTFPDLSTDSPHPVTLLSKPA